MTIVLEGNYRPQLLCTVYFINSISINRHYQLTLSITTLQVQITTVWSLKTSVLHSSSPLFLLWLAFRRRCNFPLFLGTLVLSFFPQSSLIVPTCFLLKVRPVFTRLFGGTRPGIAIVWSWNLKYKLKTGSNMSLMIGMADGHVVRTN